MNKEWVKMIGGYVAFFTTYVIVDFLIDRKVDWEFAIGFTVGYIVVTLLMLLFNKNRKK